ncbi:MAG: hypothetical protein WCF16_05210 [Alphaproteobacteria bacterium]
MLAAAAVTAAIAGWWGPAFATMNPADLSPANQAIFTTNHLKLITEPTTLTYDFEKKGTMEEGFSDTVEADVNNIQDSGKKDIAFRFLTGEHYIDFPPYPAVTGNPISVLFLERDVQDMQRLTGGNALYFRKQILNALAGTAEVKPVTFTHDGREYKGTEIRVQPYVHADLVDRFPRFEYKVYVFVLSDEIPGGYYKVSAMTPGPSEDAPLTYEAVTFHGTKKLGSGKAEAKPASKEDTSKTDATAVADRKRDEASPKN